MKARLARCLCCTLLPCLLLPVAAVGAPQPTSRPLDYAIIVTGEELLRGVYPDAHTSFLTRTLHLLGLHCVSSMTVDDRPEDLKEALRCAQRKARLIVVTGGLGPTVNDITRPTLAEFTGIALREDGDVLAAMERRFQRPREQLQPTLRRQALVPSRGTSLPNPNGTAVGLVFEMDESVIVALPGPPRELQPMVTNAVVPYLRRKFGVRPPGARLTLRFVGLGQSAIDQVLRERVAIPPEVVVSSLFEGGRVDFLFALPGDTDADRAKLAKINEAVRAQLGDSLYADDESSLEEKVAALLRARSGALVLVEVATSGDLARTFGTTGGADRFLAGGYDAPNEDRLRRLLGVPDETWAGWKTGEDRARGLGEAAMKMSGSSWALAVGGVETGDPDSRRVWVAFGGAGGVWTTGRVPLRGSAEIARASLTTGVLEWLWRRLR
jgi:nicotinamide-nucleotide amidase